ncbi:MAG: phage capsid protein [Pseudomonadota bacterium]
MSYNQRVEDHHALSYGNNVMLVTQQMQSRVRNAVMEVACSGEAHAAADLIGSLEYLESQGRERANVENPATNSRRWLIMPNEIKSGQYIEREEIFQQLYNPTQPLVRAHTLAVRRGIDDRIFGVRKVDGKYKVELGGILGRATEGKRPGGSIVPLPTAQREAHAGEGLTLDKLIAATQKLMEDEFGLEDNMDELYCAILPQQRTDLLNIAKQTGENLNAFQLQQLQTGMPTTLLGMTWIITNRLPTSNAGITSCPVWSKRNIALGVWEDINGDMWNDTHADKLPYARVRARVDCVRIEDKGVRIIECQN